MTIEERALHIAQEFGSTKANKEQAIYRACIRMAKEQLEIDIENAWKECSLIFHEHGMTKDYEPRFRKALVKGYGKEH